MLEVADCKILVSGALAVIFGGTSSAPWFLAFSYSGAFFSLKILPLTMFPASLPSSLSPSSPKPGPLEPSASEGIMQPALLDLLYTPDYRSLGQSKLSFVPANREVNPN